MLSLFELKAEDALKIYIKFIYSPKNLCCSTSHLEKKKAKKSFDKFSKYEER